MAGSDGTAVNPATGVYTDAIVGLGRRLSDEVPADSDLAAVVADIDELQLDDTVVVLTPGIAVAYNAALGHVATLAMSTDATQTITISNLAAGESCTVVATQNGAGSKALVFASTFFAGGTEPTMTAAASAVDVYTVINIGGQLYGFVAGQDMKT